MPRSLKGHGDYDVPITQKERELRERAGQQGMSSVPGPRVSDGSLRGGQRISSGEDYDVPLRKEERMRREKVASMLATRSRRMSDTSSEGSRPLSCASSLYSADASSVSLPSSHSGSKLAIPSGGEEPFVSQSSIDQQLEMIDQLVEDVAAQNLAKVHLLSTSRVQRSVSRNLDEEGGSSNSGSNDNLGVWDDISSGSDSDEAEGGLGEDGGEEWLACTSILKLPLHYVLLAAEASGVDPTQQEELLENWIKELEQGIKGMSDVVGGEVQVPDVVSLTGSPK